MAKVKIVDYFHIAEEAWRETGGKMKTRKVDVIKPCDLCGKVGESYYDAPTLTGLWANLCPDCFKKHGSPSADTVGTKFVLRDRSNQPEMADGILEGKELSTLESICMDGEREISCPNCGEVRPVEPDAGYVFTCEGCGSEVRVPCLPF